MRTRDKVSIAASAAMAVVGSLTIFAVHASQAPPDGAGIELVQPADADSGTTPPPTPAQPSGAPSPSPTLSGTPGTDPDRDPDPDGADRAASSDRPRTRAPSAGPSRSSRPSASPSRSVKPPPPEPTPSDDPTPTITATPTGTPTATGAAGQRRADRNRAATGPAFLPPDPPSSTSTANATSPR